MSDQAEMCPNCGHPNESRTALTGGLSAPPATREYAGFWIRFGSLFIDGLIIGIVTVPFGTVRTTQGNVILFFNPFRNIAHFVYAWLVIGLVNGQTLGLVLLGLRMTPRNGAQVDLGRA